MKAAVITGVGTVEVTTVDDPTPGRREVAVHVAGAWVFGAPASGEARTEAPGERGGTRAGVEVQQRGHGSPQG